ERVLVPGEQPDPMAGARQGQREFASDTPAGTGHQRRRGGVVGRCHADLPPPTCGSGSGGVNSGFFQSGLEKYALVSRYTNGVRISRPIRFGSAINPFRMSAVSQTVSSAVVAP